MSGLQLRSALDFRRPSAACPERDTGNKLAAASGRACPERDAGNKLAAASRRALLAVIVGLSTIALGATPDYYEQAPPPATGGIRGRLDIRRLARPVEVRPDVAGLGGPGPRDTADLDRGVVYLDSAPRGAFDEREPARAILDQHNERFVPHVLAVMVGTVVDFPNSDRTYHNVFSLSRAKRFDLGRYAAGRSKSVRMDRPGLVRVFCDIHSHMSAFILVFNHRFFDVTTPDGRFELPSVPAGTYTLVGWYEGEARVTRSVVVPPTGWTEVELVVP